MLKIINYAIEWKKITKILEQFVNSENKSKKVSTIVNKLEKLFDSSLFADRVTRLNSSIYSICNKNKKRKVCLATFNAK